MKSRVFFALLLVLAVVSCRRANKAPVVEIPQEPDYADTSQWFIVDRNSGVDLFYVISTETGDYIASSGNLCHYADTYDDTIRRLMEGEMIGVDRLLSGDLNYYSPYYRQCTLHTFLADSLVETRKPLAMHDVCRAFDYYMEYFNQGRPFILAGFSQGAMVVVDLVKHMDSVTFSRMVAAYVIGWKVTDEDVRSCSRLRPAADSADIGVTVCFNTVRESDCAIPMISEANVFAINPVNWSTGGDVASFVSPICDDTLTVALDTVSRLLELQGYPRNDYILPLVGKEGNYHSLEISLYSQFLRHNMALRAKRR